MLAINFSHVWDVGLRINTIVFYYIDQVNQKLILMQAISMLKFLNKVDAKLRIYVFLNKADAKLRIAAEKFYLL